MGSGVRDLGSRVQDSGSRFHGEGFRGWAWGAGKHPHEQFNKG